MRWLRSRFARGVAMWTLILLIVGAVLAAQATWNLYNAAQTCFFESAVPCPTGHDPAVAQLTLAFVGMPIVWLAGIGVAAVWRSRGRRHDTTR